MMINIRKTVAGKHSLSLHLQMQVKTTIQHESQTSTTFRNYTDFFGPKLTCKVERCAVVWQVHISNCFFEIMNNVFSAQKRKRTIQIVTKDHTINNMHLGSHWKVRKKVVNKGKREERCGGRIEISSNELLLSELQAERRRRSAASCLLLFPRMKVLEEAELCFPQLLNTSCRRTVRPHSVSMLTYILLSSISLLTVILNLLVIISISHFK